MNHALFRYLGALLLVLCCVTTARGDSTPHPAVTDDVTEASTPAATDEDSWNSDSDVPKSRRHHHRHDGNRDLVSIGHDSTLESGHRADSVVSVLGSSTDDGDAVDVVSVLGDTRVSGSAQSDAVAVFGSTYVDGKIDGDAVAVFGNVELGPHADIGGDVVAVFGSVQRDPAAIVHGALRSILGGTFGPAVWLRSWIRHCLLEGRPLALLPELTWAWGLALGFLAFYALLGLLFPAAITRCAQTFDAHPGSSLLASIITGLLLPVLIILLCVTVIGIAAIPFLGTAALCAGFFGRAVLLAWIGTRILSNARTGIHPALAILTGGGVVLVLYVVPVVGFLVFQLLGILGFGAVIYTLIQAARAHQAAREAVSASSRPAAYATAAAAGATATAAAGSTVPPPGPSAAPAPQVTAALPRAGFWLRMGALFLDVLLVGFVVSVLHHEFHLQLLLLAIYGAVMWKLRGSTVGGIVFDLRVVRLDGREVDWETAIVRALGCFLSLAVAGLGFIWIVFDDSRQAWHDKIAGTVVVRVPKG